MNYFIIRQINWMHLKFHTRCYLYPQPVSAWLIPTERGTWFTGGCAQLQSQEWKCWLSHDFKQPLHCRTLQAWRSDTHNAATSGQQFPKLAGAVVGVQQWRRAKNHWNICSGQPCTVFWKSSSRLAWWHQMRRISHLRAESGPQLDASKNITRKNISMVS